MLPTVPVAPDSTHQEQAALEKLATELAARGLTADLRTPHGRQPHLHVHNPSASALAERIYCQADAYWWSWAERITDCGQPTQAADTVARVLAATANVTGE